jgi:hypothetical protein
MTEDQRQRLRGIKTFNQLLAFLREDLDWPIENVDDEDDLTFDWSDDLGLKDDERVGIKAIKQLRPLESGQPWGIFFIDFEKKRLPIVILRRVLNALVMKKRAGANRAERAAWKQHDLLFISAYGKQDERELTFAHFSEPSGELADSKPTLRVLGWDDEDTNLKLDHVADVLHEKLTWPQNTSDLSAWRQRWADAFELRPHQVIDTAQELAMRLAELAKRIRNRAMRVLPLESESGALRKLMKGFKTALIHDLTDESFADMYAQTITYGLFSASVSRTVPGAGTAVVQDNVVDMIPVTNPFLKEMLQSFLKAGGRKGKLDFDELGIQEVVDLLNDPHTHLDAVLRDFGNKTRGEDPVIHFYEHFLSAYNKKLKVQRGVFYTPQPVVSYIVRSVHELLQTEFGLEDGLADTTTWGEMLKKHSDLKLPPLTDEPGEKRTISPDEPFVQILDPATGTATFLVEVIDIIHRTLLAKWKQQRLSETEQRVAWNDYVPQHLLPRLHAFELMMAPYAIAHVKVGLKLAETGYRFGSEERARIYLTNALEPWVRQLPLIGFGALAHEAAAVNEIKRYKHFTVVIGNPPYSLLSANLERHHRALVEDYKFVNMVRIHERGALQLEKNLNDDYVKFIRLTQLVIQAAGVGVSGLITNHSFLDNPTMRGMRWSLLHSASRIWLNDLHGNSTKQEQPPFGEIDENVFQIKQGVAITVSVRLPDPASSCEAQHHERWGTRESKEFWLGRNSVGSHEWLPLEPTADHFLFVPQSTSLKEEFERWPSLPDVMPANGAGYITARDNLVIDFECDAVVDRVRAFSVSRQDDASLLKTFEVAPKKGWDVRRARKELKLVDIHKRVIQTNYRPFDSRWIFFDPTLVWGRSWPTMKHVVGHERNLTMLATRMTKDQWDVWVARTVSSHKAMSAYDTNSIFPLFLAEDSESFQRSLASERRINFSSSFLASFALALGLQEKGLNDLPISLLPESIFYYAYAVFHSPGYRSRYAEFLKIDFPRLPLTGSLELFRVLGRLGSELTALHLLESPKLDKTITKFIGATKEVAKVGWTSDHGGTVWIDVGGTKNTATAGSSGFQGVPEAVWNFHIGGYQVCEKWLKDRRGRTLSPEDITHYQKIVVALSETIRLMAEIDQVIDQHGGWPDAFATASEGTQVSASPPPSSGEAIKPRKATQDPVHASIRATATPDLFSPAHDASNDDDLSLRPARVADVDDLSRDGLCAEIRQLFADNAKRDRDDTIAELARTLGYQRTGKNIRETLDNALRTAVRRGILENDSDGLKLGYRTIEQFEAGDRDRLKDQFLASLNGGAWIEREDAMVAFSRWLGYRRTGSRIIETGASLINGLLREHRLESDGTRIRRAK